MIRVQPSAFLVAAALVLLLPLDWLFAVLLASAVHEAGHLAAIYAFGGHADSVTVGLRGAEIHTVFPGKRKELFCAAAGPAASLLLISLYRFYPKLAVCAAVQGLFNLIPVYPMDGGRMLRCFLQWLCPRRADRICRIVECLIVSAAFALSLSLVICRKDGVLPVLVCVTALTKLLFGKIPCKSGGSAVQ